MILRIELQYKTKKGTETVFSSEEMPAEKAHLIGEDLLKTGRAKELKFIDKYDSSMTMKELKKYLEGVKTEPHNLTVYFDGGFDIQTKKSGLGCVIYYEQNGKALRLRRNALVTELDSNNEAEYAAIHLALLELMELGAHHLPVRFIGDSQVVINQLKGEWAVYEEEFNKWIDRIEEKLDKMGLDAEYELVSRKENKEADQLATQALKEIEIMSTMEIEK
ncbi:reverse transcriptase-like protein [Evansella sp. LMS18]|jgi:ribonuclease HI|uniref:reverse transcriptase-like protein n=1 Tax=Evansella sp. LMS18 TaxID=2924033 RepID=UPI0020D08B0C|nr:reverse transcriptase-like protein [Evansella sp. LMS18]UTR10452.1 reverse transcriptase-like protein [Evansella sp. LMS18]